MRAVKIAVIGRGIAGLTAAMHLLRNGFSVTVFGSDQAADMASLAATGVMAVKGLVLPQSPLFAWKLRGHQRLLQALASLEQASGHAIPHECAGAYELYADAHEAGRLLERIYHRQFRGAFGCQVKTLGMLAAETEAGGFWARLATHRPLAGALYYPNDGWFDPEAYLKALASIVASAGGLFAEPTRVERVEPATGGGVLVHCPAAQLPFDEVLVAAGAGTAELLQSSGLKPLPLVHVPGQTLSAKLAWALPEHGLVLKAGALSLAIQRGRIVWGAFDHPKNRLPSPHELEGGDSALISALGRLLGQDLAHALAHSATRRLGVRVLSRDRLPLIGFWPFPGRSTGVWLMTALHKSGFSLADLAAENLVALIKSKKNSRDPIAQAFAPGRWSR